MTVFSSDWTTLAAGSPVRPYSRGQSYESGPDAGDDVWLVTRTPHESDVAWIEGKPGSKVPSRQVRKSDGWELSRA
jgi:hypothetical protein